MTVDSGKVIDWYRSNEGKITYSMGPGSGVDQGPRQIIGYGKGGSTDCSGGITSALYYGGAEPKQEEGAYPNYSTMNIGSLLSSNGYEKIYSGPNTGGAGMWDPEEGDIVNMGAGSIENSAGSAGHIGVMADKNTFASVTFSDGWGRNKAVHFDPAPAYWGWVAGSLTYFEVWRNAKKSSSKPTKPSNNDNKKDNKGKKKAEEVSGMYRFNNFIFGGISGEKKKKKETKKEVKNQNPSPGGTSKKIGKLAHIFDRPYYVVQTYGQTPFSITRPDVYPRGEHTGLDLSTDDGANGNVPVYACCDCHYVDARFLGYDYMFKGWGFITDCPELGGYIWYGHLSSVESFTPGQEIKAGTKIGIMGDAGGVFHVHFEHNPDLSFGDGDYLNPSPLIPYDGALQNNTRITP